MDARSDVYSLACVLYEMLTGEPPFTGPTAQAILVKRLTDPVPSARRLRETITPEVDAALQRALARAPADRFATSAEFSASLLAGATPTATPAPPAVRRKSRLPLFAALALFAVVAVGIGVARRRPPAAGGGSAAGPHRPGREQSGLIHRLPAKRHSRLSRLRPPPPSRSRSDADEPGPPRFQPSPPPLTSVASSVRAPCSLARCRASRGR